MVASNSLGKSLGECHEIFDLAAPQGTPLPSSSAALSSPASRLDADMFTSNSSGGSARRSFNEIFDLAAPKGMAVRRHTMSRGPSQLRNHLDGSTKSVGSFVSAGAFASNRVDEPLAIPEGEDEEKLGETQGAGTTDGGMVNSLRNFFSRKSQFQSLSSSNGTPKNLYSRPPGHSSWRPSGASLRSFAIGLANFFGGSKSQFSIVDEQEKSLAYFKKEFSAVLGDDHPDIKVFAGHDDTWMLGHGIAAPVGIFHPYSGAKVCWDMLAMWLLFYSIIATPIKLTFDFEAVNGCSTDINNQEWHFYADLVVDIIFLLDIIVVFRTAFFDQETRLLVTEPWLIARRYLRSYFVLDLLSAVPLGVILMPYCGSSTGAEQVLRAPRLVRQLRMLRILRLLRISKVKYYLDTIQDRLHIHPGVLRLMKFTLIVFMVTHLNACLFFLLGESYKGDDGTQETWTTTETNMLPNGLGEEVVITRLSIAEQYCVSLYWSTTTLTTLGYGDITPITLPEVVFCTVVIIEGGAALGWVVGSMADLLSRLNLRKKRHYERMQYWEDVFYRGAFPPILRRKIRSYLEYMLSNGMTKLPGFAQRELSKGNLRSLMSFIYREHLRKVPWFRSLSDDVLTDLALALDHISVPPGEIIYREGETGDTMYLLQKGAMQLSMLMLSQEQRSKLDPRAVRVLINDSLRAVFKDGIIPAEHWGGPGTRPPCAMFKWSADHQGASIFGASCLFSGSISRLSSAKALSGCTLLTLSSGAMLALARKHPSLRKMGLQIQMRQQLRIFRAAKSVISERRALKQAAAKLIVTLHAGINMPKMDALTGSCDAYCVLDVNSGARNISKARSAIMYNTYSPEWREAFTFHLTDCRPEDPLSLKCSVIDWDAIGAHDPVGDAELDLADAVQMAMVNSLEIDRDAQWVGLTMPDGKGGFKKVKGRRGKEAKIQLSYRILPADPLPNRESGELPESPNMKLVQAGGASELVDVKHGSMYQSASAVLLPPAMRGVEDHKEEEEKEDDKEQQAPADRKSVV